MSAIMSVVNPISGFLWTWAPLLLIAGGVYFTIRTKGVQFRLVGEAIKVIMEKPTEDGISSFGAFCVSTASRVGTGNVIGVATAIATGGPGAIFWMWITALIGGASGFVESTLAQIYKKKDPDGGCYGGPAYYIEAALHSKPLAIIFCICLIACYGIGFNMLASYNLQSTFVGYSFYDANPAKWAMIIGGVVTLATLYILLGGGKRIVNSMNKLVPIMGLFYIIVALVCIIMNITKIPAAFSLIFSDAFNFQAIFGGFAGSCMMLGFKRGLYSNEAGIGSAPNAAASAVVSHPVKQGLVQMVSVYVDTILICTATGLMCVLSGINPIVDGSGLDGAAYAKAAAGAILGPTIGPNIIVVALVLFAFSTLCGNFYFIENCISYLHGKKPSKTFLTVVRVIGAAIIFLGAVQKSGDVWDLADFLNIIMAYINIPICVIIGSVAYKCLDDYVKQKQQGKEPVFKAANVGLGANQVEFWK